MTGPLVATLRRRLIDALVAEASPQAPWTPDFLIRSKIEGKVNPKIDNAINGLGGMANLTEFVGLGVAGAISGAIHDNEGKQGVKVASDAHPTPWTAFGDDALAKSPVSEEQATKAIAAAKGQVDAAYRAGEADPESPEKGATSGTSHNSTRRFGRGQILRSWSLDFGMRSAPCPM